MRSYIQDLVSYLESSFVAARRIHFHQEIDEISLDVSQAVPLGLILNEAITNAVKYAFPGDRRGTISIILQQEKGSDTLLRIADNGVGLPGDFDLDANSSLGVRLMKLFADQLEGDLKFCNTDGVEISLRFKQEFTVDGVLEKCLITKPV